MTKALRGTGQDRDQAPHSGLHRNQLDMGTNCEWVQTGACTSTNWAQVQTGHGYKSRFAQVQQQWEVGNRRARRKQNREMVQAMQTSQCHQDDTVPTNAEVNLCAGHLHHCGYQEW